MVRVDELDGLRGLLAMWVVVAHAFCCCGLSEPTLPSYLPRLWRKFIYAQPAVETFIILSGFAISFLIHNRPEPYRVFITRRFLRIYPVYLICLIAGMGTIYLTPFLLNTAPWRATEIFDALRSQSNSELTSTGAHIFWHITLLHGLLPKQILPDSTAALLIPAWSLSLEWQYYLIAPLLAYSLRSGFGILLIACIAWLGISFSSAWQNPHLGFLPPQLPLFLVGIGSYHLYALFRTSRRDMAHTFTLLVAATIFAATFAPKYFIALSAWAVGFGCIFADNTDLLSRCLVRVRKILLTPLLQKLGQLSFPLYLVHWPAIILFLYALLSVWPTVPRFVAIGLVFSVGLPTMLLLSLLLHKYVELPSIALAKSLRGHRKAPSDLVGPSPHPVAHRSLEEVS